MSYLLLGAHETVLRKKDEFRKELAGFPSSIIGKKGNTEILALGWKDATISHHQWVKDTTEKMFVVIVGK